MNLSNRHREFYGIAEKNIYAAEKNIYAANKIFYNIEKWLLA